jgi:DNA-binding NarL/FixJ family response regulator
MAHAHKMSITPRQREVLKLISRGLTMKEIASQLNVSTRTAETHKYEMMQTLGVETTADLIRYSLRLGLISQGPLPQESTTIIFALAAF